MSHINANAFPEGTGYGVGWMDPAVSIEHILWDVFTMNTINGVANILARCHYKRESQHECDWYWVVKTEDGRVNLDMFELEEALQATEHIQHVEERASKGVLRYDDDN